MKKFNDLEELINSLEYKNKDLSNCDLSDIDLSQLKEDTWDDFIFFNTNFRNTNIYFDPYKLHKDDKGVIKLENCNFTNCNLEYLYSLKEISIKGSNFSNTHLDVYLDPLRDSLDYSRVIFSKEMERDAYVIVRFASTDMDMIRNNPSFKFPSYVLFSFLFNKFPSSDKFLKSKEIDEYSEMIDFILSEDKKREGHLCNLMQILESNGKFSKLERIRLFQKKVYGKYFKELDFSKIPTDLLVQINFENCKIDKLILPEDILEYDSRDVLYIYDKIENNEKVYTEIPEIIIPKLTPNMLMSFPDERLGNTNLTFKRNLYLELGRVCNGNCQFCRNKYLRPCKYDIESIRANLRKIAPYLNNIVIGGGEPTLFLDDLKSLTDEDFYERVRCTIFTNASLSFDQLWALGYSFHLNISRHAINDDDNNKILGVKSLSAADLKALRERIQNTLTLCATCFNGGLKSVEDLEDYIAFSDECMISNLLFQSLHKDLGDDALDSESPIDDAIFDEMIIKLQEQGYKRSSDIYSTGDYKLVVLRSPNTHKVVSFKKYITKEELEREWHRANKRTFDLSMAPDGEVYENWHQSSGKVLLRK